MTAPFAYDTVEYPTAAMPQAHPEHLYAVARMFGLDPAPVERCRYLEVGCGDGMHLIAAAVASPEAEFVGIDLSSAAITRGCRIVADLQLPNVSLYAADLTTWEPDATGFDYAIAHGLYSWVPPSVRDSLLALLARSLRAGGLAYVSYNAYPGCYIRRMAWEILRFHTDRFPEPMEKIGQAQELIKLLLLGQPTDANPTAAMYRHELDRLLNDSDPRVLYHDDLSTVNDPVYFHEFVAHARRFGFRYVADAEQKSMEPRAFPPKVAGVLDQLAERDPILKEQYLDFLRLRRFRQSILSADGQSPRKGPDPACIATLLVSGNQKPVKDPVDLSPGVEVTFTGKHGASARTDLPIAKAALVLLPTLWPARVPFPELVRLAAVRLGRPATDQDAESLGSLLTAVWMAGMIHLHGFAPNYQTSVFERPVASPLARLQARIGQSVTTLLHDSIRLEDEPSRLLIQLLDGTRTRDDLTKELQAAFPPDETPDPAEFRAGLNRNLERLARSGLLMG